LAGAAVGAVGLWLATRRAREEAEATRAERDALKVEAARLGERANLAAQWEDEAMELKTALTEANLRAAKLETERDERQRAFEEQIALITSAQEQMLDQFKAASGEAMQVTTKQLLDSADAMLKRFQDVNDADVKEQKAALDSQLKPLQERLKELEELNRDLDRRRQSDKSELGEHIKSLSQMQADMTREAHRLSTALRGGQKAGQWGEMVLRRVLEMAGMDEYITFDTQAVDPEEGRSRPDCIIRLPGERIVIIDSKAPTTDYLHAAETELPDQQDALLDSFAKSVLDHAKKLGKREYEHRRGSLGFVVLFLPSDGMYQNAARMRPDLVDEAMRHHVLICGPTTLVPMLKAFSHAWQQEKLARSVLAVQESASQIYDAYRTLSEAMAKMGRQLQSTVREYDRARGTMHSRLEPRIRKFRELGIASARDIETPQFVEEPQIERLPSRLVASPIESLFEN
jgi:DNA recombination protein RmuC